MKTDQMPKLYPWQAKEVEEHGLDPKGAIFASPRIGKTLAAIMSAKRAGRKRLIVVAPTGVCPQWCKVLGENGFWALPAYEYPRPKLLRALRVIETAYPNEALAVVIGWRRIGSETPDERKHGRRSAIERGLHDFGADGLVLDESHEMASPGATQSKVARRLAWGTEWTRLLTGTPAPNHYGGLFCQLMALDPRPWEEGGFGRSYERLAQMFLVRDTMFPSRVLGHINSDILQARMAPLVRVYRREDVFGPDCWVEDEVKVEMPPAARKLYAELAHQWIIESSELNVTANHILTRMLRLRQLAAGYVTDDNGVSQLVHTAKLDAVMDKLRTVVNSNEKAVVFHHFTWEGEQLEARAQSLNVPVYRISGATPPANRALIVGAMAGPGAAIAVVQTQSGGVGISFAEVAYQITTSESYSFVKEEQAHDRTFKPNTQRFVTHFRTANTVDESIAQLVQSKVQLHSTIKNMDKEALAFGRIKRPSINQRRSA